MLDNIKVNLKTAETATAPALLVSTHVQSPNHWDFFFRRSGAFLSGLHLEEALELEGHQLPAITGVHWEGHPVAGGLRQHARRGRLAKLRPCIAWTSLGGQKCAEVRHRTFPVLIVTGGKTDRSALLCRHGLPRLWRPVVDRAFVVPAMPVMVKGSHPSCRCRAVLLAVSLLTPTKLVVFLGQGVFRMRNWNVISLSTSHASAPAVTFERRHVFVLWKTVIILPFPSKTSASSLKENIRGLRAETPV